MTVLIARDHGAAGWLGRSAAWFGRAASLSRSSPASAPTVFAIVNAAVFLVVRAPVGDLWAARARQSAASHGVGLTYWFSWFGGGSTPGNYSVLTPYLSTLVGAALLGALGTVAITPLCWRLVRTTNCPLAATWTATVVAGFNLWSGRIPFAVGSAVTIAVLIAVRDGRRWIAAAGALLAVLVSPVSAVFVAIGLTGTLLVTRSHRSISATTIGVAAVGLGIVALLYGSPGPEPFGAAQAAIVCLGLVPLLLARPPKFVVVVVIVALVACPLLVVVPNAMGTNFQRLVWICLPVAVVATAGIRLPLALAAAAVAVVSGARGTVADVRTALQPTSSASYYTPLENELDSLPDLVDYRVEVVADGTHTAAYALLEHAALARGYESQSDNSLNAVLLSRTTLTAASYRTWLADNAVGYVALPAVVVHPNPEYSLVSAGRLRYLQPVWSDANWTLMRVSGASPIVAAPARMVDADQSNIEVAVPRAGPAHVRIRWSKFLRVTGPDDAPAATTADDGSGWTTLTVIQPGTYVLHGSATGIGA